MSRHWKKYNAMKFLRELNTNEPDDFKNYLSMDLATFDPYIQKQDTIMKNNIPPEEWLIETLRFLVTGRSYESLKFSTEISV